MRGKRSLLGAIGRFAIRRRWSVLVAWVVLTVVCTVAFPSLGSVTKNDNSAFLPADAPSVRAASLASPFQDRNRGTAVLVASRVDGPLGPDDQEVIGKVESRIRGVPSVTSVRDESESADGQARTALVEFDLSAFNGGPRAARAVDTIRGLTEAAGGPGLELHLTGTLPVVVDQQRAANHTQRSAQVLSIVLILALLLLVFRAALAPLVTLLPAGLALALSEPLIAESTQIGVQISSLLQIILVVLVLGAGTDYGLFLIFRYREGLRRGLEPVDAIAAAISRVGTSITFSAATVIAALLSLVLASFGLYRGVGPGLAIGVGVILAVELTLLPALLAILGRSVFWPSVPRQGQDHRGLWGRIAVRVCRRPVATLLTGVSLFAGLSASLFAYAPSGFNSGGAIPLSDSSLGEAVLYAHYSPAEINPTSVVFRLPRSVWSEPSLIDSAQIRLMNANVFDDLVGALNPNGGRITPEELAAAHHHLGPPQWLAPVPSAGAIPLPLYDSYRATEQFVSASGRTMQFYVSLDAGSPSSTEAFQAMPGVRAAVAAVARHIGATQAGVAGQAAAAADVSSISGRDVVKVIPLVLVVLFALLAMVLRSLVAPIYLVLSVGLSYLASLGLAVLIFVVAAAQLGINFTLPFFMFIFIMALGEDYNILVMSRIREETERMPLRSAVPEALGATGSTVTSAGLILAGTFGVLAITAQGQVRQIGTGLALGILLDTFVVRTLLVPSIVVLLGRWNWWPSQLWRRGRGSGPTPMGSLAWWRRDGSFFWRPAESSPPEPPHAGVLSRLEPEVPESPPPRARS